MIPLSRLLIVGGTTWYLGSYLFMVLPKIYNRGDIAFLGYIAALLAGAGAVDLIFASSVQGQEPSASDIKANVLRICGGLATAWYFGPQLGAFVFGYARWLSPLPQIWAGWAAGFLAGVFAAKILLPVLTGLKGKGGYKLGGGWYLVLRPVKGRLFDGFLVMLGGIGFIQTVDNAIMLTAAAASFAILTNGFPSLIYLAIGKATARIRRIARAISFGKGGDANFGGMFEEFENTWRRGQILLGSSSYKKTLRIGLTPNHMVTFGSTGSGKGRAGIISNLLLWLYSVVVIDPKGTNAAVTYRARKEMGQNVYAVDPFYQLRNMGVAIDTAFYNPLLDLDPFKSRFFEDINALADGIVVPRDGNDDDFWDKKSREYIAGLIEYVVDTEPAQTRTLMRVRELLLGQSQEDFEKTLNDMMIRGRPGGMARYAATDIFKVMESKTYISVITTVGAHLLWLGSPDIQRVLSKSSFSFRDLQERPTTVYLVLPPEELDYHGRFLRLFVAMGLRAVFRRIDIEGKTPKKKTNVMYILDEFLALGRLSPMIRAVNVGRSYQLYCWPICQTVDGMFSVYGKNGAQNFIDAAGAIQIFSVGNLPSAEWVSSYLGTRDIIRPTPDGQYVVAPTIALRTGLEVQSEVEKGIEKEIILRHGKRPLYLQSYYYDKFFPKKAYDPDPDHRR